jgi:glucose-6-phosphate dehydrogenase assembly protein OpcA
MPKDAFDHWQEWKKTSRSLDAPAAETAHEDLRSSRVRTPGTASLETLLASGFIAPPQPGDDRQLAEEQV